MYEIKVTSVEPLEKYKIHISFNDRTHGVLDLSHHAGKGVFKTWEEDNNFFRVFLNNENGAITWPGEIDIDTLHVWFTINRITPEEFFQSQTKYAQHF